jgi:hypothetical protein
MDTSDKLLFEAYQQVVEKRVQPDPNTEESLKQFLAKRLSGAIKIADSSQHKGGFATLTAIHYKAKLKPYRDAEKMEKNPNMDCDKCNAHYKKMAKQLHAKLADLDKLSQREFQSLMGELEVYGEVYIRATKPESLKI